MRAHISGLLIYFGLGLIMAGITRWSLSVGLIVGGALIIAFAHIAKSSK